MAEYYVGEIRMWTGVRIPTNWHVCDGTLLPVSDYQTLFSLLGVTYGGNGVSNFGLPDLRGRVVLGQGAGPGLTPRVLATSGGVETVALTATQIPAHTHAINATTVVGTTNIPTNNVWANTGSALLKQYSTAAPDSDMGPALSTAGRGLPHNNMMPSMAINFIIALNGIFPQQS